MGNRRNGASSVTTDDGAAIEGHPVSPAGARGPMSRLFAAPLRFRLIPPLDRYPRAVAFAQTLPGRIALFAVFALLLQLTDVNVTSGACHAGDDLAACFNFRRLWFVIAFVTAFAAYGGRLRWWAVAFGGAIFLGPYGEAFPGRFVGILATREGVARALNPSVLGWGIPALVFLFSACLIAMVGRYRDNAILRRPILLFLSGFAALVALAASSGLHGTSSVLMWSFVGLLGMSFPTLGYALHDSRAGDRSPLLMQAGLGTLHRFWGYTQVPFGKGIAYLRKFEAKTAPDLAVTQLKGIKLMLWVIVLKVTFDCFAFGAHTVLELPKYLDAIAHQVAGNPYPWYICWASLVAEFIENLLRTASVDGGIFVAIARMAGFRLLRNTYRPLEARTLAEFWNRYLFYFKELLVDFFFYPTFLTCFRKHKRLRLFFATFMAACIGNMIFHFIRDIGYIAELGPLKAMVGFQTYFFYTLVLATGIGASQMWPRRPMNGAGWLRARFLPSFRVAAFYCVLQIFDYEGRELSLADHFRFLFHLFGIDGWI